MWSRSTSCYRICNLICRCLKLTQKAYSHRSRARIMSLKSTLQPFPKDRLLFTITFGTSAIGDDLTLIAHPIDYLVIVVVNGHGPNVREFSTSIRTTYTLLQFDELFDKLVDFEIYLQCDDNKLCLCLPQSLQIIVPTSRKLNLANPFHPH
jgi:hypothetical protein